jgi:phosphoglucosamine mutase
LKSAMTKFPQTMVNVKVDPEFAIDKAPEIQAAIKAVEQQVKNHGRVLLRPSGTEPVIRVMVEGEDEVWVQKTAQQLATIVEKSA